MPLVVYHADTGTIVSLGDATVIEIPDEIIELEEMEEYCEVERPTVKRYIEVDYAFQDGEDTVTDNGDKGRENLAEAPISQQRQDGKQLKACLARYMDLKAFTAKNVGKEQAARLKARRSIATTRAGASIRFFHKPGNLQWLLDNISAKQRQG